MNQIGIGDLAQSLLLSRRNATLKDSIQNLTTEMTTGLVVATTERVKGDFAPLSGIESSLTQLGAYHSVTVETALLANHMQIALSDIADSGSALSSGLLAGATSNSPSRIATLGLEAEQRLQSAMAALNTRIGDRSLFSGVATNHSAVTDAETMMTELDSVISGAISSQDVVTAVNDWFASPTGFAQTAYQGGDPLKPVAVGPNEAVALDVTAVDPAIVDMIKGLAMAALLNRGALVGSSVARADLAMRAGESLAASQTAMAELGAKLGTTEATIVNAGIRNDAEKTTLEMARVSLLAADPYETAAALQQSQTQLETLYTLTARMSRLSLVNFL